MSDIIEQLASIFESEGAREYLGENISIAEHMLQAAMRAQRDGAEDSLVVAALLHDIGYFTDVRMSAEQRDRGHHEAGAEFLMRDFEAEVTEPVRLHVAAKRYLCAAEEDYESKLSPASVRTLNLQGGPMSRKEMTAFEANPHHRNALEIRRYDDEGKADGLTPAPFSSYRPLLKRLMRHT